MSDINLEPIVSTLKQDDTKKPAISKQDKHYKKLVNELRQIRVDNKNTEEDIIKMSAGLLKTLDPSNLVVPDNLGKNNVNNSSSILKLAGDVKKNRSIDKMIEESINLRTSQVSLYNTTGVYYRIQQANYNQFIEENLPVLKKSAELFIDDVNNGSFRGTTYDQLSKFKFYKSGQLITEPEEKELLLNLLVPTDYSNMIIDEKSFFDIDKQSDYTAWKNGTSYTRVVANKEIAKELYIKYVLKSKKAKELGTKTIDNKFIIKTTENKDAVNSVESVTNMLKDKGIDISYKKDGWIVTENVNPDITLDIDKDYHKKISSINTGNKNIFYTPRIKKEIKLANESFYDFVQRWFDDSLNEVHITDLKTRSKFNMANEGYTVNTMKDIMSSIFEININEIDSLAMESVAPDIDLSDVSFDDIYANKVDLSSNANFKSAYESVYSGFNTTETISTEYFINTDTNEEISVEDIQSFNLDPTLINQGVVNSLINPETGVATNIEKKIKSDNINYNKLDKIFSTIKGESIEYLDNARTIPIMTGNRLIGVYYIEYTHQDVQHYIGLRSFIGNPQGFHQNMELVDIFEEEQEETIGRLIFGDIIKPIIEKNIDIKFLKNNAEVLYTLKKLIEQNDISNTLGLQELAQYNMYNLSRIIYIPAKDIIFKRNGIKGLGTSKFEDASTPASAAIIANEVQLAWYMTAGGGMTVISAPKGLNENNNEYGQEGLFDRIESLRLNRWKMKDSQYNNFELGHKFIYVSRPDDMQQDAVAVTPIDIKEFHIQPEIIRGWIEQAGEIVGYNPAVFSSQDGNIELAAKLYELNNSKLLEIEDFRKFKTRPSSQLATSLVRMRGGESYKDVVVEWVPPQSQRPNDRTRSDQIKEFLDSYTTYMDIFDKTFEGNEEYNEILPEFRQEVLNRVAGNDSIISSCKDIFNEATRKYNIKNAIKAEEKPKKKSKNTDEEEVEDEI